MFLVLVILDFTNLQLSRNLKINEYHGQGIVRKHKALGYIYRKLMLNDFPLKICTSWAPPIGSWWYPKTIGIDKKIFLHSFLIYIFCYYLEKFIKTVLIQSIHNGLCIEAQVTIGGVYILLLSTCNQNDAAQKWKWNEDNQLYNLDTLKCISTGQEGLVELRNCTSGDGLQQWLCANHFIEQPSTGNCITVKENSQQLIMEQCSMENYRQLWNKYNNSIQNEIGFSLLHLLGDDSQDSQLEPICTIPHVHTIPECYNETTHLGWSFCQLLGYFVTGVYHMSGLNVITDFHCCYTTHVFTGQPETASSVEQEICEDVTWWSSHNLMGWFKCPTGLYFKGYLKGEEDGLLAVQLVRCCRTAQAPSVHQHCYPDGTFESKGLHKCSRTGYHIAGVYKTDCHSAECIERLYCCI